MTQPRSTLVSLNATPWYHVVSRWAHGALPAGTMPRIVDQFPARLAMAVDVCTNADEFRGQYIYWLLTGRRRKPRDTHFLGGVPVAVAHLRDTHFLDPGHAALTFLDTHLD